MRLRPNAGGRSAGRRTLASGQIPRVQTPAGGPEAVEQTNPEEGEAAVGMGGKEERGGGAGGRPAMAAEAAAGEGGRGEAILIPCRREYSVYSSKP